MSTAPPYDGVPNRTSPRTSRLRRIVRAVTGCGVLALWWFTLGPLPLGGTTTFAVVDGVSMEPTLQGGDLVIARVQDAYELGDTIVFPVANQKVVIHRIVGGSAPDGWITQGDNNDRADNWVVPDGYILGRYWLEVPMVGSALLWTREHPLVFGGAIATAILAAGLFSRRRGRVHPVLVNAVRTGRRASRIADRPVAEVIVLLAAGLALVVATVALAVLTVAGILVTPAGLFSGIVVGLGGTSFIFMLKRLGDGWRLPEPTASRYALSARCWDVSELPETDFTVMCASALEFRAIADRGQLPLLRRVDPSGADTYLTITSDGVAYRWEVPLLTDEASADV